VACVQLRGGADKADNWRRAEKLVEEAAADGARLVVLPEKWNAIGDAAVLRGAAEEIPEGETSRLLSRWAQHLAVTIVGGSITESHDGVLSSTCPVFGSDGSLLARYRKIHMFDVEVGGQVYRESEAETAGDRPVVIEAEGWQVGLTVCYDVRFPELYRQETLMGAELITVPAAFTMFTGKDHWELLLRARAVENQLYVVAANQWSSFAPGKQTYGRSMIIDPWGLVLASAPDSDCVITADLDRERMQRIRQELPSLANRRPEAYR
jgi:predicted amidohydrolase